MPTNYMAELEAWIHAEVFAPIKDAITSRDAKELHIAFENGTKAIKKKVLESYHNGLNAKPAESKRKNYEQYRRK
jgi:hypothetical protein